MAFTLAIAQSSKYFFLISKYTFFSKKVAKISNVINKNLGPIFLDQNLTKKGNSPRSHVQLCQFVKKSFYTKLIFTSCELPVFLLMHPYVNYVGKCNLKNVKGNEWLFLYVSLTWKKIKTRFFIQQLTKYF